MRGLVLFVAGALCGLAVQTTMAQNENAGVVLNHVGISVPSIPDAAAFYIQKMGFKEAFRNSDALKVTERWRRIDFGHMEETVTIDDPKAYLKPWTNKIILLLQADTEILDSYCDNQSIMQSHYSMGPRPKEPASPPVAGGK